MLRRERSIDPLQTVTPGRYDADRAKTNTL